MMAFYALMSSIVTVATLTAGFYYSALNLVPIGLSLWLTRTMRLININTSPESSLDDGSKGESN